MIRILAIILIWVSPPLAWCVPVGETLVASDNEYDYQSNRPIVRVIQDGFFDTTDQETFRMSSSVTYIYDGPQCQVLVDTGAPSDIRAVLRDLAENDILPTAITLVVLTHMHPDHAGNLNLFNYATYVMGNRTLRGATFQWLPPPDTKTEEGGYGLIFLCPNVALVHTKGRTADDLIVLVSNTSEYGNVSITGDIFVCEEDIDDQSIWRNFSTFPDEQSRARRMIIADSDYIVPGHGPGFEVTDDMRRTILQEGQCVCSSGTPATKYTGPTPTPPASAFAVGDFGDASANGAFLNTTGNTSRPIQPDNFTDVLDVVSPSDSSNNGPLETNQTEPAPPNQTSESTSTSTPSSNSDTTTPSTSTSTSTNSTNTSTPSDDPDGSSPQEVDSNPSASINSSTNSNSIE